MRKGIQFEERKELCSFLALIPISLFSILEPSLGNLIDPLPEQQILAQHEMDLTNRWPDAWVNEVFKDNILLNLIYLNGGQPERNVNWEKVKKPSQFEFKLEPDQTFAYHDDILPKYQGKAIKTTSAHFNAQEGFKTDGYLYGDGVCHLASLLYWVAKDAGILAEVPTNHDFMNIPDIPKEYGVSIYSNPYAKGSHAQQNLYITNNKDKPVSFKFEYNGEKVKVSVIIF